MSDPIYLLGQEDELTRVERTVYKTESELQRLIDRHPELIPGGAIDDANPRRWLVLRSEAGIPTKKVAVTGGLLTTFSSTKKAYPPPLR